MTAGENKNSDLSKNGLTIVLYPKCTTCVKAQKFLENKIISGGRFSNLIVRDIREQNPDREELSRWLKMSGLPVKKFFNTGGVLYRKLGLKDRLPVLSDDEALDLLAADGMLVKRPILLAGDRVFVGFNEKLWSEIS